ncbi:MAG: rod shape-determining protein MreD [Synechococcaceae cyanobacterium]|nr:rod shape-determining protein MreD [Synechococcaceae cyanobacterium]
MALLQRQPGWLATALLVPLLTLAAPGWLRLAGVGPAWAVLWLLPWALADGRLSGAVAGLGLGLVLDALHGGPVSQIPALVLLGWWWGRIGRRPPPIERSFSLALLALLGTVALDLSLVLQWALLNGPVAPPSTVDPARLVRPGWTLADLAVAAPHLMLARAVLTSLLAPVLCSLQLLLWRQRSGGWRS